MLGSYKVDPQSPAAVLALVTVALVAMAVLAPVTVALVAVALVAVYMAVGLPPTPLVLVPHWRCENM